jgi:hypothetical protein
MRRIPCDEDFGALVAEGPQSVASDDASFLSSKEGSQPLHSVCNLLRPNSPIWRMGLLSLQSHVELADERPPDEKH